MIYRVYSVEALAVVAGRRSLSLSSPVCDSLSPSLFVSLPLCLSLSLSPPAFTPGVLSHCLYHDVY